jgi:malonyl CoA-acyl carrier protein transacylase
MTHREPIAIVGASCVMPGSVDKTGFWQDVLAGTDLITDVPESHWLLEDYYDPDPTVPDKTYAKRGAFLPKVAFDPLAFGVPPTIVPATDTTQLLALVVAQRVLEDACNGDLVNVDRERVSVIMGVTSAQELLGSMVSRLQHPIWRKALREMGMPEDEVNEAVQRMSDSYVPWQESTFPGVLGNVVAGRIANRLDLHGTNCVTDAACASSFSAVSMGVNELLLGQSDMVLVGGADTMNDIFMFMCFSKTPALSKTGDCRPFSDQGDGTMLGEGLAMVALKRLSDAERDGDTIYGLLKGVGTSSDGRAKSVYAPVPEGQARAVARAYEQADYGPETVELVEAHGTGTVAGDAAEFEGIASVFRQKSDDQWCAIGSVKSQIGHTKAAAGAAGLFKIVMALHHKVLPPTIKVERPNPKLDIDNSPFYINLTQRPWIRGSDHPRRASVSSFGFGGSNFHLTCEEYTGDQQADRLRVKPTEVLLFSGADKKAVLAAVRNADTRDLRWLAYSSQRDFDASAPCRLSIVATEADLTDKLASAADLVANKEDANWSTPMGIHFGSGAVGGKTAFLFPGQGSQYLNMGREVVSTYAAARSAWDEAADLELPIKLHDIVFPKTRFDGKDPLVRLTATEWAQPAIGAASLALLGIANSIGLTADCVAGHSFGEVIALRAAGVLSQTDSLRVARRRGELMRDAAELEGSMAALRLTIDEATNLIEGTGAVIANHNSPSQVVVSGTLQAIDAVLAKAESTGVVAKQLKVATAFHSPVVAGSTEPFANFLADIDVNEPSLTVYANSTGAPYPDAASVRPTLAAQIANPVRFVDIIEGMYADGVRTFVEVGPGKVLTGLSNKILGKDRPHLSVPLDMKGKVGGLDHGLARIAAGGHRLNWLALWDGFAIPVNPDDVKVPKLKIDLNGANYGKPYPPENGAAGLPKPNPPRTKLVAPAPELVQDPALLQRLAALEAHNAHLAQENTQLRKQPAALTSAPVGHAPVISTQTASVPMSNDPRFDAWVEAQRQTAATHAAWQQAMNDSHIAFLKTMETGLAALSGHAAATPVATYAAPTPVAVALATPAYAAPTPAYVPPVAAAPAAYIPPAHSTVVVETTVAELALVETAKVVAVAPTADVDINAILLAVVADKTGYPGEMLGMKMNLEADLGIDSIKRVEILSAVREAAPSLPEVDANEMAKLQTLGQIVDYLSANLPSTTGTSAAATVDINAILLAVVADKTGYPGEMLGMEMNLEADLGIDSIKRVEILSAVREAAPGLPEVDANEMAKLQTLGQIVEYLGANLATPAASAPAPATASVDVNAILLSVVADKTGYPADMLGLEMNLESDLGIDSIKRVEILSAVREAAPGLPEVDANEMAKLQTLGQIVEYLGANLATPAAPPAKASVDVNAILLSVVADKTGYPADMLGLEMNLESDLGIDSIKRVEILSAVREAAPGLPEVDANEMAKLQTLGQIVDYLGANLSGSTGGTSAKAAAVKTVDVNRILLAVVADKTGYPADMLGLEMNLESDLGIDSIKRVEILSAVREAAPGLPEVDANEMAKLQTLGQIVDYLGANLSGPSDDKPLETAVVPPSATEQLGRFGIDWTPSPAVGLGMTGLHQPNIVIIDAGSGIGSDLVSILSSNGVDATLSTAVSTKANGVIYLGGLADIDTNALHEQAFAAAKVLANQPAPVFVTVTDPTGDRCWLGGLPGLVKTAALEWENGSCKHIDITGVDLAQRIADELLTGGPDVEVRLLDDTRRIAVTTDAPAVTTGDLILGTDDVVVASGGARGVTAACLIALAAKAKCKFVLLGRSEIAEEPATVAGIIDDAGMKKALLAAAKASGTMPTPAALGKQVKRIMAAREIQGTVAAIQASGGQARYVSADVTDAKAIDSALQTIRKDWGGITAIVHGAGVLADKTIADKTVDQVRFVFHTKVGGLKALLDATRKDSLKAILNFSSVAGRCGNVGQCDYAMANQVLDRVSSQLAAQHPDMVIRSMAWGPWEGGMVTPALKQHFASLGVPMIPIDVGASWLVNELRTHDTAEVGLGGRPRPLSTLDGISLTAARWVHTSTLPWLTDHRVKGIAVLPMVVALDWFVAAARSAKPSLRVDNVQDLKVLRGVTVAEFDTTGQWLQVHLKQLSNGHGAIFSAELRSIEGTLHYSAIIEMTESAAKVPASPPIANSDTYGKTIYGDVLFHGPALQVIDAVDGLGNSGAEAKLSSGDLGSALDVQVLDGGLQLALLWTQAALDGASLPTSVQRVHTYASLPWSGPVRCALRKRSASGSKGVCDLIFEANGAVVAEFIGVETHVLPKTKASTTANASA